MLKISDFSRIAQVPVATLRYYDQLDLLKPAQIDRFTEYRYYDVAQLARLNRILALKDLGFSLEQIRGLLIKQVSPDELRGMLKLRLADVEREMEETQARLTRVQARLRRLEAEGKSPRYEIVIKPLAPMWVISSRQTIPTAQEMIWRCNAIHADIRSWMAQHKIAASQPPAPQLANLYHNTEYTEVNLELEAFVITPKPAQLGTKQLADAPFDLQARELEGVELAACGVHRGSMETMTDLIQDILLWTCENGYIPSGPVRQLHLSGEPTKPGIDNVIEIQIPIERSSAEK
ncbi:MAG TPA: MerR family transcriptional regulator [Thermoflexales bacterium]|nr:MerR family transcriptional regulator [Thermoflexales bacterium]HQW36018.1 MerR family transcriptional regulator [Thermoflexales bacterium]HQZ22143.1 MerR family transcriptional regulator [Thermoflexales bacterium]HRA01413.1 MerR family transcriptional regulator [Thermoflexales bacterium]